MKKKLFVLAVLAALTTQVGIVCAACPIKDDTATVITTAQTDMPGISVTSTGGSTQVITAHQSAIAIVEPTTGNVTIASNLTGFPAVASVTMVAVTASGVATLTDFKSATGSISSLLPNINGLNGTDGDSGVSHIRVLPIMASAQSTFGKILPDIAEEVTRPDAG